MKTYIECIPCIINNGIAAAKRLKAKDPVIENMTREILVHLSKKDYNTSPPALVKGVYEIINQYLETQDPYGDVKNYFNSELLKLEDEFQKLIEESENTFQKALKLAIAGNIIDFGIKSEISKKMVLRHIHEVENKNLEIDDSTKLYDNLKESKTLLYLGDNCGEIVFDKIFIEEIKKEFPHLSIKFAVRGKAVINDATLEDAYYIGLNELVPIISNGDGAPGTVIEDCSEDFKKEFYSSDIIISKGQGNYESLNEIDRENVYFLFMAKCNMVAKGLNVPNMSLICKKH